MAIVTQKGAHWNIPAIVEQLDYHKSSSLRIYACVTEHPILRCQCFWLCICLFLSNTCAITNTNVCFAYFPFAFWNRQTESQHSFSRTVQWNAVSFEFSLSLCVYSTYISLWWNTTCIRFAFYKLISGVSVCELYHTDMCVRAVAKTFVLFGQMKPKMSVWKTNNGKMYVWIQNVMWSWNTSNTFYSMVIYPTGWGCERARSLFWLTPSFLCLRIVRCGRCENVEHFRNTRNRRASL